MGMVGKGFLVLQSSQVWWWGWLVDWQVSQSQGLVEVVVAGSLISVVLKPVTKSCLQKCVFNFFGLARLAPYF